MCYELVPGLLGTEDKLISKTVSAFMGFFSGGKDRTIDRLPTN